MIIHSEMMNILGHFQTWHNLEQNKARKMRDLSWTRGYILGNNITYVQTDGAWKQNPINNSWEVTIAWIEEWNTNNFEAYKVLTSSHVQAEAQALQCCLQSWSNKTRAIAIKTDCRELVKALIADSTEDLTRNLITAIKDLVAQFDFISCSFVNRSEVTNAHNLTIKARKSS